MHGGINVVSRGQTGLFSPQHSSIRNYKSLLEKILIDKRCVEKKPIWPRETRQFFRKLCPICQSFFAKSAARSIRQIVFAKSAARSIRQSFFHQLSSKVHLPKFFTDKVFFRTPTEQSLYFSKAISCTMK